MTYDLRDDLEFVYDSCEEVTIDPEVHETHFRVNGLLRWNVFNRITWHRATPGPDANLFLLLTRYHRDDAGFEDFTKVDFAYGPGEEDLKHVYAFSVTDDSEIVTQLLYWLAGLR